MIKLYSDIFFIICKYLNCGETKKLRIISKNVVFDYKCSYNFYKKIMYCKDHHNVKVAKIIGNKFNSLLNMRSSVSSTSIFNKLLNKDNIYKYQRIKFSNIEDIDDGKIILKHNNYKINYINNNNLHFILH